MTSRLLELGIQSIQSQQLQEGARLIRIALRHDLTDELRAMAHVWLAETATQPAVKLDYLRQALAYDPHNEDIRRRMSALMTAQLPPTAQQAAPNPSSMAVPFTAITQQALPLPDVFAGQPPLDVGSVQHVVAVSGGPNGAGAGCIVHPQGIIATTRHVVGMNLQVDVFLSGGQGLQGVVLRSYPLYDLAFVRVNAYARQVVSAANPDSLTENAPLTVLDHRGQALRATLLLRREVIAPHWFPTTLDACRRGRQPDLRRSGPMVRPADRQHLPRGAAALRPARRGHPDAARPIRDGIAAVGPSRADVLPRVRQQQPRLDLRRFLLRDVRLRPAPVRSKTALSTSQRQHPAAVQ